ncbi:phenylalanine--tRNA ligase subunit alpha [Candidatus Woesearchaeota archaeon]|nr:phenylalanine--tRNA ligase subunit alpha [Candidatus Woesearchaeota archaeon]
MEKLLASLHPLERKIVPFLKDGVTLQELVYLSHLKEVEVMRALQWLENKGVLKIETTLKEEAVLGENGAKYLGEGLPERRFLESIKEKEKILEEIDVPKDELNVCLGILRRKAAIEIRKDGEKTKIKITDSGKKILSKETLEEQFLKKIPLSITGLSQEEKFALESLKQRKGIISVKLVKTKKAKLTEVGYQLISTKIKQEEIIDSLTPKMLIDGSWKNKKFRSYDVKINVPKIFGGKKHHYRTFLESVRNRFLSLGFSEMAGPIVETDFWDMDALFMPQFHSARDIHAAYYIKEPKYGKIDQKILDKVKAAHEDGFKTGSKGWGYKFDETRTKRHLLRTQGTACSARMLASKDLKIPGKYFAISRCFRYDIIDATHNCDFYQTEGIVIEEGLTFRHLKSLLKMFAEEFAETESIKIKPAYFPFTEPSAELFAKHPDLGWIELGGSGIFRPEVTKPLGVDVPVIAWGLGIDRIGMFKMGIKDIRQLFSHDLNFLRSLKCPQ